MCRKATSKHVGYLTTIEKRYGLGAGEKSLDANVPALGRSRPSFNSRQ
jgi:hypothetical protein